MENTKKLLVVEDDPGLQKQMRWSFDDYEFLIAGKDRKSTRLNSSHRCISYAVFCLKKKSQTLYLLALHSHSITLRNHDGPPHVAAGARHH